MNNVLPFQSKLPQIPTPVEMRAIGLATSHPSDAYEWLASIWLKLDPEDIESLGKLLDKNPPTDATVKFCIKEMRDHQHG